MLDKKQETRRKIFHNVIELEQILAFTWKLEHNGQKLKRKLKDFLSFSPFFCPS